MHDCMHAYVRAKVCTRCTYVHTRPQHRRACTQHVCAIARVLECVPTRTHEHTYIVNMTYTQMKHRHDATAPWAATGAPEKEWCERTRAHAVVLTGATPITETPAPEKASLDAVARAASVVSGGVWWALGVTTPWIQAGMDTWTVARLEAEHEAKPCEPHPAHALTRICFCDGCC